MAKGDVESHGTPVVDRPGQVSPIANEKFNSPLETHGTYTFDGTPASREGDNSWPNRMVSPIETHGTAMPIPEKPSLDRRCRPVAKPPFNE